MRLFGLIICFMLFTGASWDAERTLKPKTLYENQGGVKWETQPSDKAEVDQPDPGWFRDPSSYSIPDSWPEWAKRRFQKISYSSNLEPFRKEMMWDKPPLDVNTKWVDALADKSKGAIEVQVSSFHHFTFIVLDPPQGIVDQDFHGNAKIYGLDDTKQYRIAAFDSRGFLGMAVTAISDKYVRALPDSTDNFGLGRHPVMAQKVVEDPNKNLWTSVYQPEWNGATYQFIDIYSIDRMGKVKASFEVPLETSYIRAWDSDLILEDDGDVTFAACERPEGYGEYTGPSFIARLTPVGDIVWEVDQLDISSALSITKAHAGGYAYIGADWEGWISGTTEQWGKFSRLDSSGVHTNWGSSGTTYINTGFTDRDVITSGSTAYYTCGQRNSWGPPLTLVPGGTVGGNFTNPLNAFDYDPTFVTPATAPCPSGICTIDFTFTFDEDVYVDYLSVNWYVALGDMAIEYFDGVAWQVYPGDNNNVGPYKEWRLHFTDVRWGPTTVFVASWIMHDIQTPSATISKYDGTAGGAEGGNVWNAHFFGTDITPGYFFSLAEGRYGNIVASGSSYTSQTQLNQNVGIAGCVTPSGVTVWEKTFPQVSEFYDIAPTEDGGFLLSGTLYSGTSVQARSAVIMKIDQNGNVDTKFPQVFKETIELGADGRGVIETRDKGYLMVGGSSDEIGNRSKPYFMKGDKFYRSCSHGDLCR